MNFMFQKETEKIQKMLEERDYVADPSILMSVYLAKTLHKHLLIEVPASARASRRRMGNGAELQICLAYAVGVRAFSYVRNQLWWKSCLYSRPRGKVISLCSDFRVHFARSMGS